MYSVNSLLYFQLSTRKSEEKGWKRVGKKKKTKQSSWSSFITHGKKLGHLIFIQKIKKERLRVVLLVRERLNKILNAGMPIIVTRMFSLKHLIILFFFQINLFLNSFFFSFHFIQCRIKLPHPKMGFFLPLTYIYKGSQ